MAVPSYNIAAGETSEAAKSRRKIAESLLEQGTQSGPIRHWAQGLERIAKAMMGGYELGQLEKAEKEREAKAVDLVRQHPALHGGATSAVSPGVQRIASALSNAPSASGKIYSNDEPSPLDPPGGADRDMAIRTVIAEAGNQPQVGREAVARVMMNRAVSGQFGGDTLPGVIQKPNQFEPWNTPQGRARMAAIDPNSPAYIQAGEAVDKAYSGAPDPTRGATHFYAPKAQAALGRRPPSWDNGTGVDIADHRFFGGAGTPPVLAGASPTDLSASRAGAGSYVSGPDGNLIQVPPGADPAAVRAGAGQPQAAAPAPVQVAQAPAAQQAGQQIAPEMRDYINKLITNPQTRAYGVSLLAQHTTPKEQPNEVREYEYGLRNPDFARRQVELKQASRPQVTVDQRGESEFTKEAGKLSAKKYADMADDALGARQMISDLETLRTLGAQIGTGKAAQTMAALGPYAQSLGIEMKGLDEAQAYESIVQRVAPNLRVKGSGAQSDYELRNFLKALPSLGNTPGGNEISSRVLEGLFQNKIAAADIANRALNGELTRSEAEKQLRDLPDPMSGYREFIKRTKPEAAQNIKSLRNKYGLE
jgi:hypothetical protein